MAADIGLFEQVQGAGRYSDPASLVQQLAQYGVGALPDLTLAFTTGVGDFQANQWFLGRRTLAAGATDDLDVGGGVLADGLGGMLAMTAVKRVLVAVASPDGTKKVRFGPNGVTNAAQLWFGGTGAGDYAEVPWKLDQVNPFAAGWAIAPTGARVLSVKNPGAGPVDYAIWVIGSG